MMTRLLLIGVALLSLGLSDQRIGGYRIVLPQPAGGGSDLVTCTTTTANLTQATVQSAVNAASTGHVVCVPAGSATWSSSVNVGKSITLAGAAAWGGGTTTIAGRAEIVDPSPTVTTARITGFTFNLGSGSEVSVWSAQGFRFDHNIVTRTNHDRVIFVGGCGEPSPCSSYGLIDNNQFLNGSVVTFGQGNGSDEGGRYQWAQALDLGTENAVYVEDCLFEFEEQGSSAPGSLDGNLGSRIVFRFNSHVNGRLEQHSLQGDNSRAVRMWELYNNALTSPDFENFRPFFIRGGTGMIFHNTSDGGFTHDEIDIDNARSSEGSISGQVPTFGMCTGSSFVDGNTATFEGWPCRDQIGRSTDASNWDYSNPAPSQASFPAYIWRNTQPTELPVSESCESADDACTRQNTKHLIESRDYYTYRSSFDGTAGVGEGTLASRPATCTTGVGYWATDQGSWNTSSSNPRGVQASGADGVLYGCTSTNTWSVIYTPYTYPHPYQSR